MPRYDYDRDDYTDYFREDRREQERFERMIDDARRELDRPQREEDPVIRVINDPSINLSVAEKKAINDPKVAMNGQRELVKVRKSPAYGQAAASRASGLLFYPTLKTKRTRKKTKMDRTMSKCLKMANAKLRNKNGKLKKGKTMSDVMKMAHRLCRKHG